jgi:hypothetical protein
VEHRRGDLPLGLRQRRGPLAHHGEQVAHRRAHRGAGTAHDGLDEDQKKVRIAPVTR